MTPVEIRHFHLFAGLGGGAKGFNRAQPIWVRQIALGTTLAQADR